MTSKEALKIIKYRTEDEPAIMGDDIYDMLDIIEKDLDKLDKVWDKVEELLQDELTSLLREIPYDMLNSIKVRILSKLKEFIDEK